MTDRYAVFGNPVAHSKSPYIHTEFAKQTHQDLTYEKILAPKDGFKETVKQFFAAGGKGANVTVPFKEEAYQLCQQLSERARVAGVVNTLKIQASGDIYGDNTDGIGIINAIKYQLNFPLNNKVIAILGAGGAARGVIKPILDELPQQLIIANRTVSKALQLAEEFSRFGKVLGCGFDDLAPYKFDLIINATSASLTHSELPLPNNILTQPSCAYDMFYNKELTPFLQWAQTQGASIIADGLSMLVEQAAESFFIWRGVRPKTAPVYEKLRQQL